MKTISTMILFVSVSFGTSIPEASGQFKVQSEDGLFAAKLNGRVQTRAAYEIPAAGEDELAFSVPRARLKVSGKAFAKGLGYYFQTDFGKGNAKLKDFYIQYFANKYFGLRVGQMKKPFSRQQLTSSGKQAFVDRAITDKAIRAGRDIGLFLLSDYRKSNFEWAYGIFNGTGEGAVPDQFAPLIVLRAGYHSDGMKGYSQADLEGGALRWAVAYSNQTDLGWDSVSGGARDVSTVGGIDFSVKAHGFAASGGVFGELGGPDWGDAEFLGLSTHVQATYAIKGKYVPGVRFAMLDPDGDDNNTMELQGGFSWFIFGHKLKWQTDFTMTMPEGGDADMAVRTQAQLIF